ncbi:acyl-CoA/acyl-ACP dehydrogenase [Nakamurella flavida]|uniref:Acyl-CoA/acyl-ACP dehydrogenase n=1 Tax=Nakamurella flavida TaxID=363630 RepID=A0A939C055_9ACTN|nr:acyl-CoA/acyl-ACP dehydrogenase [Nakamurella flavida]MBM9476368.1 acyl-CoA/acyl-ACP dehydrogenase [Nakamurella flavida]MDP9779532.1 alkylation response protein AidB-like acyl-CoA dehydrogenase [Nakamurella flavida]
MPVVGDAARLLTGLAVAAAATGGSATAALGAAVRTGAELPPPGAGATALRWSALATLAAADLTAARVAEAHLDALAILAEAGDPDLPGVPGVGADSSWGVFAAEGPGVRVDARATGSGADDGAGGGADSGVGRGADEGSWVLDGTKPWCSLAGSLSHALITAHTPDGRRLFAVTLQDGAGPTATVRVHQDGWVSRGLADVRSGPIDLLGAPGAPVGAAGWYLQRPGFAWGGMGVAACWYGGAVGIARALRRAVAEPGHRAGDQIGQMHLGAVDAQLFAARTVLAAAASAIDAGRADGAAGAVLALRVRAVVASAAQTALDRAARCLGPAPLALDEEHARRVADLQIYLRQQHAERDDAALGRQVSTTAAETGAGW